MSPELAHAISKWNSYVKKKEKGPKGYNAFFEAKVIKWRNITLDLSKREWNAYCKEKMQA